MNTYLYNNKLHYYSFMNTIPPPPYLALPCLAIFRIIIHLKIGSENDKRF